MVPFHWRGLVEICWCSWTWVWNTCPIVWSSIVVYMMTALVIRGNHCVAWRKTISAITNWAGLFCSSQVVLKADKPYRPSWIHTAVPGAITICQYIYGVRTAYSNVHIGIESFSFIISTTIMCANLSFQIVGTRLPHLFALNGLNKCVALEIRRNVHMPFFGSIYFLLELMNWRGVSILTINASDGWLKRPYLRSLMRQSPSRAAVTETSARKAYNVGLPLYRSLRVALCVTARSSQLSMFFTSAP